MKNSKKDILPTENFTACDRKHKYHSERNQTIKSPHRRTISAMLTYKVLQRQRQSK